MNLLGMIGGTSWHSTIEYYRLLNELVGDKIGTQQNPPLLLYSLNVKLMRENDPEKIKNSYLEIAKKLEEVALKDEYFVERGLYPNVDFYSGIIYRAIGIPTDMFTVLFAIGRLPGWIAQWNEMVNNKEPIGRPRQVYVGATKRDYTSIDKR